MRGGCFNRRWVKGGGDGAESHIQGQLKSHPFPGAEAVTRGVLWKKMFLEISENSQENTCARASLFIKLQAEACNFITKETLAQVFSCDFSEISKNTFFTEHIRTTASAGGSLAEAISMTYSGMLHWLDISAFYFYEPLSFQIFVTLKFIKT